MEKVTNEIALKGQMFLIAAVFIIISFFVIRNVLDIYNVFEENRSQEIRTEDLQTKNLVREYEQAAGAASMQSNANRSAQDYLFNFSSFLRNTRDARMLYLFAYSNSTTAKYSVVLGNFLNDNVNATISATNSDPVTAQFVLADRRNATAEFIFLGNGTVELNLTYTVRNEVRKDLLNITVQSPRLFMTLFTDITLEGNNIIVRHKDIYNRTWYAP